jgi:hypothetical protein
MNHELILERYEKYFNLLKRVFDPEKVENMFESLGERIAVCPISNLETEGGQPGSMVEFSLHIAQKAKDFASEHDLVKSAIRVSLVHELGRIGDLEHSLYKEQDSDWHREKLGQTYKFNEECPKMNVSHRTLFLLQHFGIELTQDEWIATLMSHGYDSDDHRFYKPQSHILSSVIQYSRACVLS